VVTVVLLISLSLAWCYPQSYVYDDQCMELWDCCGFVQQPLVSSGHTAISVAPRSYTVCSKEINHVFLQQVNHAEVRLMSESACRGVVCSNT